MSTSDSDSKRSSAFSTATENPDGRAVAETTPRPLLSELAARLAHAVKGLRRDSAITESLEEVIEESEREANELSSQERLMLANLLKFGELAVANVMVPRADIVAVEAETPVTELIALFREAQHSRLPIYRETLDDPLGMIHIKDVLAAAEVGADGQLRWPHMSITKLKRDVLFVPAALGMPPLPASVAVLPAAEPPEPLSPSCPGSRPSPWVSVAQPSAHAKITGAQVPNRRLLGAAMIACPRCMFGIETNDSFYVSPRSEAKTAGQALEAQLAEILTKTRLTVRPGGRG